MNYPKDIMGKPTTKEQWDEYYRKLKLHNAICDIEKPFKEDMEFNDENGFNEIKFNEAMSQWHMKLFCDAPNKPGYTIANND